jgi:hypothetical protein
MKKHQDHPWLNLFINILIPIFILNRAGRFFSPTVTLVLALSFPLIYGAYEILKFKKWNFFSLIGLVNITVTGSFGLLGLNGQWFAWKESFFPGLIGLAVIASSFTRKPFIQTLFVNPQLIKMDVLFPKIEELQKTEQLHQLFQKSTRLLSLSFFISAIANYFMALSIFTPLSETLSELERQQVLNEQISKMTSTAMIALLIPSMLLLIGIFYHLLSGLEKISGLKKEEFLQS